MSGLPELVATLIDNLQETSTSTDRRGRPNWRKLGSTEHCWRCGGNFGDDIEPGSQVRHHIIPTSEGGSESADNKSLLCSNCHSVVHRYYQPTGKIGLKRTRDGASRLVGKFKGGIEIFKKLPHPDHLTGHCEVCRTAGTVVGVSEGYWNGEGMLVLLDCPSCGLKFGEPFIGTDEAPTIDPISAISLAITSGFKEVSTKLPRELQSRADALSDAMTTILRNLRSEQNSTARNSERSRVTDAERQERLNAVRDKYIQQLVLLIPEAKALERECKPYVQR